MLKKSSSEMKLKLLIDKTNEKVLFPEAGKEFVDFLFSIMSLPLGRVVKRLGCIGNLYDSIESLSETYIQSYQNVESILNPKATMFYSQNPLLLSNKESERRNETLCMCLNQHNSGCYTCGYSNPKVTYHTYVADDPYTACPTCNLTMNCKLDFVESSSSKKVALSSGGGFVEGMATYMVMDNLEVKPMSTISSISLINSFNVKDLTSLEEQVFSVGVEEGSRILQASLQSKDVLTTVFFRDYVPPKCNVSSKKHKKQK